MKINVLRAKYKIENTVSNEGYLIIEDQDDGTKKIEGVFTYDYAIINFTSDKSFDFILYERLFTSQNGMCNESIHTTIYQSQTLYNLEFYCPDEYSLFSATDMMSLSLIECIHDIYKIKDIQDKLTLLRN